LSLVDRPWWAWTPPQVGSSAPCGHERARDSHGLSNQFVSVPVHSLPAGKYRLEIRVRDVIAGEVAASSAEFLKAGGPALAN